MDARLKGRCGEFVYPYFPRQILLVLKLQARQI